MKNLTRRQVLKQTAAITASVHTNAILSEHIPFTVAASSVESAIFSAGPAIPVQLVQKDAGGLHIKVSPGVLRIEPWAENIVRVQYSPTPTLPPPATHSVLPDQRQRVSWKADITRPDKVVLSMPKLTVFVDRSSGAVSFADERGVLVLEELSGGGKRMVMTDAKNGGYWQATQTFLSPPDESLYGLGGFWHGFLDHKGNVVQLTQTNPCDVSPILVSSRGYSLLWDNAARGEFRACPAPLPIPSEYLRTHDDTGNGFTAEYRQDSASGKPVFTTETDINHTWGPEKPPGPGFDTGAFSVTWKSVLNASVGGEYFFYLRSGNQGARLIIDRKLVIENWIPHNDLFDTGKATLTQGKHDIQVEFLGILGHSPSSS